MRFVFAALALSATVAASVVVAAEQSPPSLANDQASSGETSP
jgi:hypothetical protein